MHSSASQQGPLASDLLSNSKVLLLMRAGFAEWGFAWSPAAPGFAKEGESLQQAEDLGVTQAPS